jgi:cyclase
LLANNHPNYNKMIHRRSFLKYASLGIGALSLSHQKIITAFFEDPWKIKMLRNNVGIFTERGGTIGFLLHKDGIIVIDTQFPEQSNNLINELKNRSDKPFKYLLNTHHHGDHSSGNIAFKGLVENVVAHENSKINQQRQAERQNSADKQLYPDTTFNNELKIKSGDIKLTADYFGPAHTNGDALYMFEDADIVHVGDLMFNRRHPFIDRTSGASISNWTNVLDKAVNKYGKNTLYIFGHAAQGYEVTGTADDLMKFKDYLNRLLEFAQQEVKAGKSKEEFLKNKEIPGVTEWKGDGIERPLTAAFEEATSGA